MDHIESKDESDTSTTETEAHQESTEKTRSEARHKAWALQAHWAGEAACAGCLLRRQLLRRLEGGGSCQRRQRQHSVRLDTTLRGAAEAARWCPAQESNWTSREDAAQLPGGEPGDDFEGAVGEADGRHGRFRELPRPCINTCSGGGWTGAVLATVQWFSCRRGDMHDVQICRPMFTSVIFVFSIIDTQNRRVLCQCTN